MRWPTAALLLLPALLVAAAESAAPSSWKVFCHPEAAIAFAFPPRFVPASYTGERLVDRRARWEQLRRGQRGDAAAKHIQVRWIPAAERQASATDDPSLFLRELIDRDPTVADAVSGLPGDPDCHWVRGTGRDGTHLLIRRASGDVHLVLGRGIPESDVDQVIGSLECCELVDGQLTTRRQRRSAAGSVQLPDGAFAPQRSTPRSLAEDGVLVVEGRWYRVFGSALPQRLAEIAEHCDAVQQALQDLLPLDRLPTVKFDIQLCKTEAEFRDITRRIARLRRHTASRSTMQGFFSSRTHAVYTYTDQTPGTHGNAGLRCNHEVVHQYLHLLGNRMPPQWLDEGLAVLFEPAVRKRGGLNLHVPRLRARLLQAYYRQKGGPIVPAADYLAGQRYALHVQQYAEVGGLVRVLLARPGGRDGLAAWWTANRTSGRRGGDLVAEHLLPCFPGETDAERQAAWQAALIAGVRGLEIREALRIDF